MQKEAPAWTMGSRKFYIHQEVTPGPGTYSISPIDSGPNFHIGRSERAPISTNKEIPGPGSYSPKKYLPFQGNTL